MSFPFLADEKGASLWKAWGIMNQGRVLASTHEASDAVRILTSGITAFTSRGSSWFLHFHLSNLTRANMELGQFDDA
jgi:hypothetical protein